MRNAKPRRLSLVRVRTRLGTWMSTLSFIALIALLGASICYGLNLRKKPSPAPVTIAVVGDADIASERGLTQLLVTNHGSHRYHYAYSTEVLTDGVWQNAATEHNTASAIEMPPRSQRALSVRIPQEGRVWRVKLVANRVLGEREMVAAQFFRRFKLEYPFAEKFEVKGPEILNRSVEPTSLLVIAGLQQKP